MSLLCALECGDLIGAIPVNYKPICVGDVFRKFGFKQFIVISCDYQFADLLDTAEWEAALAAGKIGISPEGTILLNEPTQDTFVVDGCGREVANEAEWLLDYTTYQTALDLSDFDYWKTLYRSSSSYKLMIVDCNGIFWLSDQYKEALDLAPSPVTVSGYSPGLDFSMTKIPVVQPGANPVYQIWSTQFKLKITDVVCAAELPGVIAALNASVASS